MRGFLRVVLWVAVVGAVALAAIQFVPYGRDHTNPPVTASPAWDSPRTEQLVRAACYDCHSNETVWPWYSSVAPASWLLQRDVDEGRDHMNFSEWELHRPGGGLRRHRHRGGRARGRDATMAVPPHALRGPPLGRREGRVDRRGQGQLRSVKAGGPPAQPAAPRPFSGRRASPARRPDPGPAQPSGTRRSGVHSCARRRVRAAASNAPASASSGSMTSSAECM